MAILRETKSKLCPNCSEAVILKDGCDHIKCICGVDWCFRCEQKLPKGNPYKHMCVSTEVLNGQISRFYY